MTFLVHHGVSTPRFYPYFWSRLCANPLSNFSATPQLRVTEFYWSQRRVVTARERRHTLKKSFHCWNSSTMCIYVSFSLSLSLHVIRWSTAEILSKSIYFNLITTKEMDWSAYRWRQMIFWWNFNSFLFEKFSLCKWKKIVSLLLDFNYYEFESTRILTRLPSSPRFSRIHHCLQTP